MCPRRSTRPIEWLALLALAACGGDDGTLVIGLTSDLRAGSDIDRLEVVMRADGEVASDQSLPLGSSAGKTGFPTELSFEGVGDGDRLTVDLTAYLGERVRLRRHVETEGVEGERRLVRVNLDAECTLRSDEEVQQTGLPSAPACDEAAQTCIDGVCAPAEVPPEAQEPYSDDWPSQAGDVCKPKDAGAPEVIVGQGQSDYLAAEDGVVGQVEAGPQGGHHVWISARIKNLRQRGSITEVGGELVGLGMSVTPLKVIFTLQPDEGDYCKVYGLRFQLDGGGVDIEDLLGEEIVVRVTVTDIDGDAGTGELRMVLSDSVVGG